MSSANDYAEIIQLRKESSMNEMCNASDLVLVISDQVKSQHSASGAFCWPDCDESWSSLLVLKLKRYFAG